MSFDFVYSGVAERVVVQLLWLLTGIGVFSVCGSWRRESRA